MNTDQLKDLFDQRFSLLERLLGQSEQQIDCIKERRMTELMQLLSSRQKMIETLTDVSRKLSGAVSDDPNQRSWRDASEREHYRSLQIQCDQMHQDLLAIEAKCESMLQSNRTEIESELHQFDRGHHAANRYQQHNWQAQVATTDTSGGTLDLSE